MHSSIAVNLVELLGKEARKRLGKEFQRLEDLPELDNSQLVLDVGRLNVCPFCHYESEKNKNGSAKLFATEFGGFLKCFHCGIKRRVKL